MKIEVDIKITPQQLAELFCEMNDDEQTRFFGDVAHIMSGWKPHERELQIEFIGSHLVDCECGGAGARELIKGIYRSMVAAQERYRPGAKL